MVADKNRSAQVTPVLSMKLSLGGQRFIVDMRSYHLIVSNSGGDCRGLRISASSPTAATRTTASATLAAEDGSSSTSGC